MKKTLFFALTLVLGGGAMADEVKSLSELALLPVYCSGTQQVRSVSKDTKPIEDYVAMYGQPYYHLHHYCWALNSENNAWRMRDKRMRDSKLIYALGDIKYVQDRSEPDFVLLPDILNTKARILFSLRREGEAVSALNQTISIKPDYAPAYARLSDYYVDTGNKAKAIAILEQGIGNTEQAARLLKKLEKLGKTYRGVPGDLRVVKDKKEESKPIPESKDLDPGTTQQNASRPSDTQPSIPANPALPPEDSSPKPNPYCRFCP